MPRSVPDRIAIHYETTARRLIQDDEGRANGVEATGANNRTTRLRARAVVLASGGFEGNPEMLSRYLGPQSQFIRPVARGGYYNRGEGIRMALEIGAAPCGDYGSFHAQPVDPRSGQHEPVVLNYPYGILVNREGRRFVDEAPATVDASYEAASRRMMAQTEGIAFAITDARLDDVPNWQKSVRTDLPPVEAEAPTALGSSPRHRRRRARAHAGRLQRRLPQPMTASSRWRWTGSRRRASRPENPTGRGLRPDRRPRRGGAQEPPVVGGVAVSQIALPAVFMRGGTSKGLFFHRRDLPAERARWDALFLAALGSPDPHGRQLDGMGGGISSASTVTPMLPSSSTTCSGRSMLQPSARPWSRPRSQAWSPRCGGRR